MGNLVNIARQRFGLLTVKKRVNILDKKRVWWKCKCDCGRTSVVRSDQIRSGHAKSCGCLGKSNLDSTIHGHTSLNGYRSKEYQAWQNARERCYNPKAVSYSNYGGRGIGMHSKWRHSFTLFLKNMGPCPSGCTLERIDNDGNYELGNCRWATKQEQMRNRHDNVWLEYHGRELILTDWARELDIPRRRLAYLIREKATPMTLAEVVNEIG